MSGGAIPVLSNVLGKFCSKLLEPMVLDSPGEWLSVSTKFVWNPMSIRKDIRKTR